jgi:hypothetical protein
MVISASMINFSIYKNYQPLIDTETARLKEISESIRNATTSINHFLAILMMRVCPEYGFKILKWEYRLSYVYSDGEKWHPITISETKQYHKYFGKILIEYNISNRGERIDKLPFTFFSNAGCPVWFLTKYIPGFNAMIKNNSTDARLSKKNVDTKRRHRIFSDYCDLILFIDDFPLIRDDFNKEEVLSELSEGKHKNQYIKSLNSTCGVFGESKKDINGEVK